MLTFEGGATDAGRVRRNNEDYYGWRRPATPAEAARGPIYVVADGVGGEAAGEAASRLAVETFLQAYYASPVLDPASSLRHAVGEANAAVHRSAGQDRRATTLVGAAVVGDLLHVANVGDSRLYLVRADAISQITRDHNWVQEQVRAGYIRPEEAGYHPRRNVITRWLGQEAVDADVFALELEPDDRVILCTDGLTKHVNEQTIRGIVQSLPEQAAADELVRLANEDGGSDNVTAVVVRVAPEPEDGARQSVLPPDSQVPGQPRRRRRWPFLVVGPLLALLVLGLAAVGTLYVLNTSDGTAPLAGSPVALAVGPDGSAYVADQATGDVIAYPPGGLVGLGVRLLGQHPNPAARWSAGEPNQPPASLAGLAVGPDGTVYVADGGGDRIRAYTSRGELRSAWGSSGSGPGQLNRPSGVAVDGQGSVYVADTGNRRVQRFDPTGSLQSVWGGEGSPEGRLQEAVGVAVDGQGSVYVADAGAGRVVRFDSAGNLQAAWGGAGSGELVRPQGLAVDLAGDLYVADAGLRYVRLFAAPDRPGVIWNALWPTGSAFQEPTAVAVDGQGNLYVLDARGGGIHVLRPRRPLLHP